MAQVTQIVLQKKMVDENGIVLIPEDRMILQFDDESSRLVEIKDLPQEEQDAINWLMSTIH